MENANWQNWETKHLSLFFSLLCRSTMYIFLRGGTGRGTTGFLRLPEKLAELVNRESQRVCVSCTGIGSIARQDTPTPKTTLLIARYV